MSEIQNNQGLSPAESAQYPYDENQEALPEGVAFKGEQTDLRYDAGAFVNKAWINAQNPIRAKIGDYNVSFGLKEVQQVHNDLKELNDNFSAVQKASKLFTAFQGYASKRGDLNPDKSALALEHYAATNEFTKNVEIEED